MSVYILQISLMSGLIKNKQLPDSQRLPLCLICRGKLVWMKCVTSTGLIQRRVQERVLQQPSPVTCLSLLVTLQKLTRDSHCWAVTATDSLCCPNRIQDSLLNFHSAQEFCTFLHQKSGTYDWLTRVLQGPVRFIMPHKESRFATSLPLIGRASDTRKPLAEGDRGGFSKLPVSLALYVLTLATDTRSCRSCSGGLIQVVCEKQAVYSRKNKSERPVELTAQTTIAPPFPYHRHRALLSAGLCTPPL